MQTYSKFRPTGFDSAGLNLPDQQHWLVVPVMQTRDSGPLDESNFNAALEMLGGESETVEVHRFGHWGPGWIEIIIVDPADAERVTLAEQIESSLENYPVLDDEDHSKREYEAYQESWNNWGRSEYQNALSKEDYADVEGFTGVEIAEQIEDFSAEEIDTFRSEAAQAVNWEYQPDGDGVTINIKGLVDETDYDAVIELALEGLREKQFRADVTRLGKYLKACPAEINLAIRQRINTVTGFLQLMQGSI